MNPHPTYDRIVARLDPELPIDLSALSVTINGIDDKATFEMIQSLILHHATLETGSMPENDLYGSKLGRGGKGVIYSTDKLPPKLVRIIHAYLRGNY